MDFQVKFSAIGAGNMATAIIDGVLHAGFLSPSQMGFYDHSPEKQDAMTIKGLTFFQNVEELCSNSRYIMLSVKPQVVESVLIQMKGHLTKDHVIISIAAGISEHFIKDILGEETKLVLVMPNTPLMVGEGATAISCCQPTTLQEFEFVKQIFSAAGMVREVPSSKLNEIIPVNGSSPAFIYLFAKCFCEYANEQGIDPKTANDLFCQALIGSAHMMLKSGKTHQELIDMVTSPKGTTLMGLEALEKGNFKNVIEECCKATIQRAYELGR
ncbi:MAG: pyrroline-5-carboxylate reductase [Angelakisella sp.]|nr:pyrroline-5-carboxylate reductase [Angelakisella sp.]